MSAFYVGQRVRVVRCFNRDLAHLLFSETTIIGRLHDEWHLGLVGPNPLPVTAPDDCLEPILPPGLESDAEIAALFEPAEGLVSA